MPLPYVKRLGLLASTKLIVCPVQHLPFSYKNKGPFIVKLSGFCVISFGLPFWAAHYQLYVCLLVLLLPS